MAYIIIFVSVQLIVQCAATFFLKESHYCSQTIFEFQTLLLYLLTAVSYAIPTTPSSRAHSGASCGK